MTSSLRPRPHHPVLRRCAESVQFGAGPGGPVEVRGGAPELRRLLLEWRGGQPVEAVVRRAVAAGVPEPEVRAVLAGLRRAGALIDVAAAERVQAARAAARVQVVGYGPLLPGLTGVLTDAGIGRLAEGGPADLVVLAGGPPPDPPLEPHLLVRLVDGVGLVGPLVLPRRSACLRCVDLHLAARDPCWPAIAAGLAGRVGSATPATVAATAALAAEQALAALDAVAGDPGGAGPPPPTLDGVLELDPRRGRLHRRHWPPHPGCPCGARHTRPAAPGVEGMCAPPDDSRESRP